MMAVSPRAGACTTRSCAREGVQEKQLALAWRWRGRTRPDWSRRLSWSAAALIIGASSDQAEPGEAAGRPKVGSRSAER